MQRSQYVEVSVAFRRLGLCYRFYHFRFHQFGPDKSAIGPISFVPISHQRGSQGKPLKASKAQRGLSGHRRRRCPVLSAQCSPMPRTLLPCECWWDARARGGTRGWGLDA